MNVNLVSTIEISIVLPCCNEAETLPSCIEKAQYSFARLGINGEILVVDKGSNDNSVEIAKNLNARVVQVIERLTEALYWKVLNVHMASTSL